MQSCVIARQFSHGQEFSDVREGAVLEARQVLGTDKIHITNVSELEDSTHRQDGNEFPHKMVHFTFQKDE